IGFAHGQRKLGIAGNELGLAGIMLLQVLDDDARFRDGLPTRFVAQYWKLADRPELDERFALLRIAEIDQMRRERNIGLVKRDQRLVAVGRQRMEVERE